MRRIRPEFALQTGVLRGVGLEDRGEYAVLEPAGIGLGIGVAGVFLLHHMAANVVAPVAIAHIGSCSREVRKELKHRPFVIRIAGETQLIAVAAEAAPTVIDQRPARILAL